MNFRHRFEVHVPLARVSDFHSKAASMSAITPPLLSVRLHHTPHMLGEGNEMDFSPGVGPLAIRWMARIERVSSTGFTEVVDEITLRPPTTPGGGW